MVISSSSEIDSSDSSGGVGDALLGAISKKKGRKAPAARKRKPRKADVSSDEESSDDVWQDPYPLEGKYKDEEDRARLEKQTEILRETELARRGEERQASRDRHMLRQRLKKRKRDDKSRRRDVGKGKMTKKEQLAMLRQARRDRDESSDEEPKKKKRRSAKRRASSSSESDYGGAESSEEESSREAGEMGVDDADLECEGRELLEMIVTRKDLLSWKSKQPFDKRVVGMLVRLGLGFDAKGVSRYRICRIAGVKDVQPYAAEENVMTTKQLNLQFLEKSRWFKMRNISNSPPTEEELTEFARAHKDQDMRLPSKGDMRTALANRKELNNWAFTSERVKEILLEKEKAGELKITVAEQIRNVELKLLDREIDDETISEGDRKKITEERKELLEEKARLEKQLEARKKSTLSKEVLTRLRINENNARRNQEIMVELAQRRKRAVRTEFKDDDPFERRQCKPQMFVFSEAEMKAKEAKKNEAKGDGAGGKGGDDKAGGDGAGGKSKAAASTLAGPLNIKVDFDAKNGDFEVVLPETPKVKASGLTSPTSMRLEAAPQRLLDAHRNFKIDIDLDADTEPKKPAALLPAMIQPRAPAMTNRSDSAPKAKTLSLAEYKRLKSSLEA